MGWYIFRGELLSFQGEAKNALFEPSGACVFPLSPSGKLSWHCVSCGRISPWRASDVFRKSEVSRKRLAKFTRQIMVGHGKLWRNLKVLECHRSWYICIYDIDCLQPFATLWDTFTKKNAFLACSSSCLQHPCGFFSFGVHCHCFVRDIGSLMSAANCKPFWYTNKNIFFAGFRLTFPWLVNKSWPPHVMTLAWVGPESGQKIKLIYSASQQRTLHHPKKKWDKTIVKTTLLGPQGRKRWSTLGISKSKEASDSTSDTSQKNVIVISVKAKAKVIWVFPKIGVPPKWMVYNGKPY